MDLLNEFDYEYDVIAHDNPQEHARFGMSQLDRTVQIGEQEYHGILSEDGRFVSIFNIIDSDDLDFLGRFQVDENNNLIEHFPMTGRVEVVGRLLQANTRAASN